jgi:hypothetical protein
MYPTTRALPLGRALVLDPTHPVAQLGQHLGDRSKLGGDGQRELERIGHRPVGAEDVERSRRTQPASVQQRRQPVDPGPVVDPLHPVVQHRVGRGVDQLVEHRLAADQLDHAGLLGRPEVLPPVAQRVLAPRQELVKMLDELRVPAGPVVDHHVVVVAHRARQRHLDVSATPRGSDSRGTRCWSPDPNAAGTGAAYSGG